MKCSMPTQPPHPQRKGGGGPGPPTLGGYPCGWVCTEHMICDGQTWMLVGGNVANQVPTPFNLTTVMVSWGMTRKLSTVKPLWMFLVGLTAGPKSPKPKYKRSPHEVTDFWRPIIIHLVRRPRVPSAVQGGARTPNSQSEHSYAFLLNCISPLTQIAQGDLN